MSEIRKIIGSSGESRVLEIFAEWREIEVSINDLHEETNLPRNILQDLVNMFLDRSIIKVMGKGYTINLENNIAIGFTILFDAILKDVLLNIK